jgi:ribose transport system substrate-binding protein
MCRFLALICAALSWGLIALCGGAVLGGCGGGDKKLSIAVIPKGTSHVFWQSVHAGANRAARELGIDDPVWEGPTSEKEVGRQINIVDDMMARGVSALVLAPLDQKALAKSVERAYEKMPVVIFDSAIVGTDKYTAFVATDNEKGGRLAGEHMLKLLGEEGGQVILVRYAPESASTLAREKGFRDAVTKGPSVKLIQTAFASPGREEARAVVADVLVGNADARGIFACNESTAVGALMALKEKPPMLQKVKDGKLHFIGFDSSPELAEALDQGTIHALVLQDPVRMGYNALKAAYAALKGQAVAKDQPIEPTLITPQNKDKPGMAQLLRPNLEKDLAKRGS